MEFKKAIEKCMYICSQREYCINDIEVKLMKWEVNPSDREKIISHLLSEKFIDHIRYVTAFVNDKFNFNHWGKIKIRYHLKQKRIEEKTINNSLDLIDDTKYDKVILKEINKKRRSATGKNDFEKNQKTARYVISKGFEPYKVFKILNME